MRRISSSFTVIQKLIGICLALGMFTIAYVARASSIFAIVFGVVAGITVLFVWWRFTLPAAEVFMDETALYVRSRGAQKTVPFTAITKVETPLGLRNPPIVVRFTEASGSLGRIIFIPSIRENGGLFGDYKLKTVLQEKLAQCQAPGQRFQKVGPQHDKPAT